VIISLGCKLQGICSDKELRGSVKVGLNESSCSLLKYMFKNLERGN
jgi:hypothetical protein